MKCNRGVCNNEGVVEHKDIRKLYCVECAHKINFECHPTVLFDIPEDAKMAFIEAKRKRKVPGR